MLKLISKSGEFTQLLVFLVIAAIFWIPAFTYPVTPMRLPLEGPLFEWLIQLTAYSPAISLSVELGFVIFIAVLLNMILISNDLVQRKNLLPAILTVLLLSWNHSLQALNPVVPGSFFVLISIYYLLTAYNVQSPFKQLFTAGIMIGVASMFYLPFMILIFGLFFSLLTLRINSVREWSIPLIAFSLPFIYWISVAYLLDKPFPLAGVARKTGFQFMFINELRSSAIYWVAACWFFLLITLFAAVNQLNAKLISIRRKMYIIIDFLFIAVLILSSSGHVFLIVNSLIIIFLSAFFAVYIDNNKRTGILDILLTVFTISLVLLRFMKL